MYCLLAIVVLSLLLYTCRGSPASSVNCSHDFASITGAIYSYNYPFDYTANLTCAYRIHRPPDYNSNAYVCFKFRRFQLELSTAHCLLDHLDFGDRKFCYQGNFLFDENHLPDEDVFNVNFCRSMSKPIFQFKFLSDNQSESSGFYTEYKIHKSKPEKITKKYKVCSVHQWRCFNRECVDRKALCDGVKDCSDGSDETLIHARCSGLVHQGCNFDSTCMYTYNHWQIANSSLANPKLPSFRGNYTVSRYHKGKSSFQAMHISLLNRKCFRFSYSFSGSPSKESNLRLVLMTNQEQGTLDAPLWSRDAYYISPRLPNATASPPASSPPTWYRASIPLSNDPVHLLFESFQSEANSAVAIDDISLVTMETKDETCSRDDLSCNFEENLCGWTSSQWISRKRTGANDIIGPAFDTSSRGMGLYAYVNNTLSRNRPAILLSPPLTEMHTENNCLMFSYYQHSNHITGVTLALRTMYFSSMKSVIWLSDGKRWGQWINDSVDLSITEPMQLVFEAKFGKVNGQFALDNVVLYPRKCLKQEVQPAPKCPSNQVQCEDGSCSVKCNKESQYVKCRGPGTILCPNSIGKLNCIYTTWICDSFDDCDDAWDESSCNKSAAITCLPPNAYKCSDPEFCYDYKNRCRCNDPRPPDCSPVPVPISCTDNEIRCFSTKTCVDYAVACHVESKCFSDDNDFYIKCPDQKPRSRFSYMWYIIAGCVFLALFICVLVFAYLRSGGHSGCCCLCCRGRHRLGRSQRQSRTSRHGKQQHKPGSSSTSNSSAMSHDVILRSAASSPYPRAIAVTPGNAVAAPGNGAEGAAGGVAAPTVYNDHFLPITATTSTTPLMYI